MSRNRFPMISSVLAILAMATAWGATFTDHPWDIVLIVIAIISIAGTTGMIGYWATRMKQEADAEDG